MCFPMCWLVFIALQEPSEQQHQPEQQAQEQESEQEQAQEQAQEQKQEEFMGLLNEAKLLLEYNADWTQDIN